MKISTKGSWKLLHGKGFIDASCLLYSSRINRSNAAKRERPFYYVICGAATTLLNGGKSIAIARVLQDGAKSNSSPHVTFIMAGNVAVGLWRGRYKMARKVTTGTTKWREVLMAGNVAVARTLQNGAKSNNGHNKMAGRAIDMVL